MPATVLVPSTLELHAVRATREPGPPSFAIHGLAPHRTRPAADRVRCGMLNAGLSFPTGAIDIVVEPPDVDALTGIDIALALAVLLVDPAHRSSRRRGLVAWGALRLDGSLAPGEATLVADLPSEPWVGRFWHPADEVPSPDDDAVISIVAVNDLVEAWEALLGLNEVERCFAAPNN